MKSLRHPATFASMLLALVIASPAQAQSPIISATKSDDTPAATKKAPGSTVTYTNLITNSGTGSATGVTFTDPDVAGAVVVPGTLKVSPIALDDTYTGTIASGIAVNTATATNFSVITNDFVGIHNGTTGVLTITAFDATSANGGTVSMTTSGPDVGKFTYTSAAGYAGQDSFSYTISNSSFTNTGTVRLTVTGPGIIYVSATGNDTTGKGTAAAPYKSLPKAATVDGSGDRIFLFSGAYTDGMAMESGEQIIGQGVIGASFDAVVLGVIPGSDSAARPTIGGTKPTITAAAGNVITLASDNVIRGVTINSTAAGFAVAGTSITNFQLGSTSAGLAAADTTVSSSGTSSGCLSLTGVASGTVNVTGQLTATAGRSVLISDRTGGSTSVIGKVIDNGTGISLASNTGATFNFRCLNLTTGGNTAFSATGGGTVNATNGVSDAIDNDGDGSTDETDEANTITTTTATALNVANTTIGASGLTFRSISSASPSGNSAIVLNTTGTSGGLTVTGTGSASSGGQIFGKSVTGISLTSTANLNLNSMTIFGNGDAIDENGIRASNLFGTCALTNVTASFNFHANVHIRNASGATPLTLTVSGCTFDSSRTHDGFDFFADPSGVASPLGGNMTLSVSNSTFSSNFSDGLFGGVTSNTTTGPGFCFITATTSTFNDNGANGMAIVSAGSSDTKFNIFSNVSISGNPSFGVNLFQNNGSTSAAKLRGVVNNNTITYSTSGGGGACLLLNTQGAGSGTVEITNNILNYNDGGNTGLTIQSGDGASPGVLHVKTTGNTINVTGANPLRGMLVESGITSASTRTVNWHPGVAGASDDTVITRDGAAAAVPRIIVRKRVNSFFNIHNLSPTPSTTAGQVQAHLSSVMGITPSTDILVSSTGSYQVSYLAAVVDTSAATGAPLMFASGGVQPSPVFEQTDLTAIPTQVTPAPSKTLDSPVATVAAAQTAPTALTQAELDTAVASALERWIATGLTSEQIERLKGLSFEISSLPGLHLGEAGANVIRISSHAGGNGWFMDASTASDSLFSSVSAETRRYTEPTAAPAGRIDLLTTLMHEMGHALGLSDSYNLRDRNSIMYGHLTTGERRLPAKGQAVGVTPHEHGDSHFLTAPIVIGVLPPGKDVVISYDVTINDPATVSPLSSQGTVSGSNFSNVLTDDRVSPGDPILFGAADPTFTRISQPEVSMYQTTPLIPFAYEDSGTVGAFTFELDGPTATPFVVNFSIVGTAASGTDYTVASGTGTVVYNNGTGLGTIVIPAGSSLATLTITPTADTTVELDENFTIIVNPGTGYDISFLDRSTFTILNDDTTVSIDPLPETESTEDQIVAEFAYLFRRTGDLSRLATVNFSVGGTATFNTDYTQSGADSFSAASGTVVFLPGQATRLVRLDPTQDIQVENDETIILTVTSGTGYLPGSPVAHTATILNDDVNVSLVVSPASTAENSGTSMVYTFTRTGGPLNIALPVYVDITGTAFLSTDCFVDGFSLFSDTSGFIIFTPGSATKTVTITPRNDATIEPDETVILTLNGSYAPSTSGNYTVGSPDAATGTIINDDTGVTVAVTGSPVAEDGASPMTYTFTRTGSTTSALMVNFRATGTASAVNDYTLAPQSGVTSGFNPSNGIGFIVIPAGSASTFMELLPTADTTVEPDETAILTVDTGSGYDPGVPAAATGTITNDDAGISIDVLPDASLFEDQTLNFAYTFSRTGATTGTTTVNFSVGGSATFAADYTQSGATSFTITTGTVVFNPGETTKVVTLDPTNDNVVESNETIILTVTSGTGYSPVPVTARTATIVDDDVNVSVSGPVPATSVEDSGTGMIYTFTRSGGSVSNALSVFVGISGTAGFTGDYTSSGFLTNNLAGGATITFAGGSATKTVTITPTADATGESDETVILTVGTNGTPAVTGGYAVGGSPTATGTINDDDTQVTVAVAPLSVGEQSGTPLVYTFTRTGATTSALTANFTVAGSAALTTDYTTSGAATYTAVAGTVTIPVGQSSATVSVTPVNDPTLEGTEDISLTVAVGSGYVPGVPALATGAILDDEVALISVNKTADGTEGPPIVNGNFRISMSLAATTNTTISFGITGTATSGVDYTALPISAVITAGNTFVDVPVPVLNDGVNGESPETVIISLFSFSWSGGGLRDSGSPLTATVTIAGGPVPVASALGDTVTDNGAPSTDGATNIGKFDLLRRSGALAENGDLVFSGNLLVTAGPPVVTLNDFQGIWAKDAANPLRLIARSGSVAPGTSGALFDILPEVPAISDGGDVTFLASLRIGTGSPAVTASNDTGIWTTLSVLGANPQPVLAVREGSALASPSNAVITKFATGVYATASVATGVIVFSGTEADGKTGVYVMTMLNGAPLAAVTTAKQGVAAPGAGGEVYDHLASGFTDPARMDSAGNFCYSAKLKPSGKEGIWYAPIATGNAAKVVIMGDAAPGTTTTFSRLLDLPVMGGTGVPGSSNIAFHAYVAATGDNAANDKADGIWKGVAPSPISTYTLAIRCGDTVAGLPGGAKVGNMWSPWMSNANHLALRAWVDIDGNGVSGSGTDVTGLFTDTNNTMTLVVKQGDVAPGMGGVATFNFMDLPVIGGQEQMAFIGTVTGGGTTAANNQGIWRQAANGGALSLIARTGDTVSTTQGTKTISKIDFPGTSQTAFTTDHRWEQRVMDGTGRMILQFTFTDGTTSQVLTP